jgi:hypothetical protein
LYAADRVLIPVKDMPSLENCRNIFALFDQRGIDKKSLALIPCLIDSRIKFEGIFRDQKTLLRSFAANRGYRCLDTFISKSPKVESLNTNPDGKIYPILTHAKGTEVYGQFMELARDILRNHDATDESRACLYHNWLLEKETRKKESYLARLEGLTVRCLICGSLFVASPKGRSFYFETSDRASRGFLHINCVTDMICSTLYGMSRDSQAYGTARLVVSNKIGKVASLFALRANGTQSLLDYRQFSMEGEQLFQKDVDMPGFDSGELNGILDKLYLMLNEALAGFEGKMREGVWLAVYPVDPANPEAILHEDNYKAVRKLQQHIGGLLNSTSQAEKQARE